MPVPRAGNSPETPIEEWVFEDFGSLNTKVPRPSVGETEFFWTQNWMPLGVGRLRTLYAEGATLYNAISNKVVFVYQYVLQSVPYWAVFFSDGTAVQVNENTSAITTISSTAGTFYNSGTPAQLPACAQFQNKYLAIVNNLAQSNYWIWDGAHLYGSVTSGSTSTTSLSPDTLVVNAGTNYTSAPTVTVFGGSGTGATVSATVKNGSVTQLTVTNPGTGYLLNDQPVLLFSGGGSDTTASVTPVVSTQTGGIGSVFVTDGGSSNINASTNIVLSGGGGSGAELVITGLSSTSGSTTRLVSVGVINPGSGYTSAPTISFSPSPSGTPPTIVLKLALGEITGITVNSGGSGYNAPPGVSIVGDGAGASFTATVSGGAVTGFTRVSGGSGYTKAVAQLTGGNNTASGTVSLMSIGTQGTTVETYQNRVWIGNNVTLQGTAPGTTANFAVSAGGVLATLTDSTLRAQITRLAQSSGYLYVFGDSSISVISNVTTSTAGVTSYNLVNVDPQMGTSWRDSVAALGRALVFANPSGVYTLYGGAAEKVSSQLDGLFLNATWSNPVPTAAVATIFNDRVYLLNFKSTNPYTNATQTMMALWNGQKWFTATQLKTPLVISTQEVNSIITAYGCDGANLYPMFQTPSASLTKVFQTKLRKAPNYTSTKRALRAFFVAQNNGVENNPGFTISADTDSKRGDPITLSLLQNSVSFQGIGNIVFTGAGGAPINFAVVPLVNIDGVPLSAYGKMIGYSLTSTASDLDIISFTTQYSEFAPYG